MVATDVPGCREVVIEGTTGLLVPARDAQRLAAAVQRLLHDGPLRARLGAHARALAERDFGAAGVIDQTLAVYRELAA
jgi:glycosyltransferase involved in cell wall biosynthesis